MADFIYCLNSSTIKPTPILDKIAVAGEVGYEAIELWHDDIDLHLQNGGSLEDIRKAVDDHGLAVPTTIFLKGWWDNTGEDYDRAMDEIRRRLNQASVIGAKHSIGGPPLGKVDLKVGAEQYRKLLEVGIQEFNVRPIFEYLGFSEEVNTVDIALQVLEDCGHPEATTVVDPFHCFRGGGPIESLGKLKASQVAISHFNDAPADPPREQQHDPDRVMPGDGCVDLKLYLDQLRKIGYDQCLSLELFRRDLWEQNPREVAKVGLEKMRAVAES